MVQSVGAAFAPSEKKQGDNDTKCGTMRASFPTGRVFRGGGMPHREVFSARFADIHL